MRRKRKYRQREKPKSQFSSKDILGFKIMGGIAILVFVFGGITFLLQPKPYDSSTYCLLEEKTNAYVLIVDLSDGLTHSQSQYILQLTRRIKDKMQRYDRLTVYTLHMPDEKLIPVFDKCNPGSSKEANPIYQNPRAIEKTFNLFFESPLDTLINDMRNKGTTESTPLLETLTRISQKYTSEGNIDVSKFYIVSNFMQHSNLEKGYSHYRSNRAPTIQNYQRNSISRVTFGRFSGAEVSLFYLLDGRRRNAWVNQHIQFWVDWFRQADAFVSNIEKII